MLKKEIMAELDFLGVKYDKTLNKPELQAILDAELDEPAVDAPEPEVVVKPRKQTPRNWGNVQETDIVSRPKYGWEGEQLHKNRLQ